MATDMPCSERDAVAVVDTAVAAVSVDVQVRRDIGFEEGGVELHRLAGMELAVAAVMDMRAIKAPISETASVLRVRFRWDDSVT